MLLFAAPFVAPEVAHGTIIYVDDDNVAGPWDGTLEHPYQHVQSAIDYAGSGDTVYVCEGTYYENIVVHQSVSLIGQDAQNTIMDGGGNGIVVTLTAGGITIKGFTVRNGGSDYPAGGIFVDSTYNVISGNVVTGPQLHGIVLESSSHNTVSDNTVTGNEVFGIYLHSSSNHNTVSRNTVAGTGLHGIDLNHADWNVIAGNTVEDHEQGIQLWSSSSNTLRGNTISNNLDGIKMKIVSDNNLVYGNTISGNQRGIFVCFYGRGSTAAAQNNTIYHNNFTGNGENSYDTNINNWDDGYPSGGNYWDDYTGIDNFSGPNQDDPGSDGIGDTAYYVHGEGNNLDRFPLMSPWNLRGDANGDGVIDVGDVVCVVNYLYRGGDPPVPVEAGDANCDGVVDVGDVVYLVNYLYRGGPPPGC
ncbi:MAG: NosD domain-containing protein [Candidatus Zixiibacteriota bacterium]